LYKTELSEQQRPWKSCDEVEYSTLKWVDWFNNRRLMQRLGDIPPVEYEHAYYDAKERQAMVA